MSRKPAGNHKMTSKMMQKRMLFPSAGYRNVFLTNFYEPREFPLDQGKFPRPKGNSLGSRVKKLVFSKNSARKIKKGKKNGKRENKRKTGKQNNCTGNSQLFPVRTLKISLGSSKFILWFPAAWSLKMTCFKCVLFCVHLPCASFHAASTQKRSFFAFIIFWLKQILIRNVSG